MRTTEIKVGIMAVLGVIVLFFGALYLNDQSIARGKKRITVVFPEIEGLNTGDLVKVQGVKKGQVEKIQLEQNLVRVQMLIDKDVNLKEDCIITIRNLSLMGGQYVEISPGFGSKPAKLDDLKGYPEGSVTGMLSKMVKVILKLDKTISKVNVLLERDDINKIMKNTATLTGNLNGVINENRQDLRKTLRNMRILSARLNRLVSSPELQMATRSLGRIGPQAEMLIARLSRIARDLEQITTGVKKGKGTLGKVIKKDDLYNDLKETLKEVKILLKDIKRRPQRYIKIRVF